MPDNMTDALIESSISVSSLGNECFICYEDMSDGNDIMTLPCCKKELHKECLEKWHEDKEGECKCPHCMEVLYTKIDSDDSEQVNLINANSERYERLRRMKEYANFFMNSAIFYIIVTIVLICFFSKE